MYSSARRCMRSARWRRWRQRSCRRFAFNRAVAARCRSFAAFARSHSSCSGPRRAVRGNTGRASGGLGEDGSAPVCINGSNARPVIRVAYRVAQVEICARPSALRVKVFVEAYGCTQNYGEARLMREALRGRGHDIVEGEGDADAHVLVTCTVVETTERKMVRRMTELAALEKPLIVAGCMAAAQRERVLATVPRAKLLPPRKWPQIVDLLDAGTACGDRSAEIEAQSSENVFKFLDVPVQSGEDGILEAMRGEYTVAAFEEIVRTFRRAYPRMMLSTDVIVGFPGETEEQFDRTMDLIRRVRPDIVNVTRFSARTGTPAARMPDPVVGWRTKERSRRLTRLRFEIAREIGEGFVGEEVEVLLTEQGKGTTVLARTPEYRQVVLPGPLPLGNFARVRIEEAHATDLRGRVLGVVSAAPSPASPS